MLKYKQNLRLMSKERKKERNISVLLTYLDITSEAYFLIMFKTNYWIYPISIAKVSAESRNPSTE